MIDEREFERELLRGEVGEQIRAILASRDISQRELAERLGLSEARVSVILKDQNLTLGTLADIGWALGLRFEVVHTKKQRLAMSRIPSYAARLGES